MKKNILLSFFLLISLCGYSQINTGFENGIPDGWTQLQTGDEDPGFVITQNEVYEGENSIRHEDVSGIGLSTAWLITDQQTVTVGTNEFMQFYYRQNFTGFAYDFSGVYISTASADPIANPDDFTLLQEFNEDFGYSEDVWTEFNEDLSSYAGDDVYIAFRYTGDFAHELFIDNFKLIATPDCVNPEVNYEVVSDCANGQQFLIDVNVTDLGGDGDVVITDDQGVANETVSETGTITIGPYDNGAGVVVTVENAEDSNCSTFSDPLGQNFCGEVAVDCDAGPTNSVYCYDSNELLEVTYIASDENSVLNLNVNSGTIYTFGGDFIVYDSDGTTVLYQGQGDDGDLSGVSVQSTGDQISIEYEAGFYACGEDDYTALDIIVACATCENPQADFTTVPDCDNGPQFLVEVDLSDLGSATDVDITDNQGNPVQTVSAAGTFTFGPYPNGTPVLITVDDNQDDNCSINSGEITEEYCSALTVDCSEGPVNSNVCYANDETIEITYTSNDGTNLNLTVNEGEVENNFDEFIVLDTDGSELYNGYGDAGDLSGLTFQSTGDAITVQVVGDFTNSCVDTPFSGPYTPIDLTVSCATCVNPEANYTVVGDCEDGNDQFLIDVQITDLGSANSLSIQDDQGNSETTSATGTIQFGPYPNNTDVTITVENEQDGNCVLTGPVLTQDACPPENNSCADAIEIPVNSAQLCAETQTGTLEAATASNSVPLSCEDVGEIQDVWFQFTATSTTHMLALTNDDQTPTEDFIGINSAIYEGECGSLSELYCNLEFSDPTSFVVDESPNITATDLTVGDTYYVRAFAPTGSTDDFNICVTTPNYVENSDCGNLAPFCAASSETNVNNILFAGGYYYLTQEFAETGPYYECTNNPPGIQPVELPNPAWYYLEVEEPGDLDFEIIQNTAYNGDGEPIGQSLDVDFTTWGPFESISEVCENLTEETHVPGEWSVPYDGCDYSPASIETLGINSAESGEIYVVIISNFDQNPGYINIVQTNTEANGAGTTNCDILTNITDIYTCSEDTTLTSPYDDAIAFVWYEYDRANDTLGAEIPGEDQQEIIITESGSYASVTFAPDATRNDVEVFNVVIGDAPEVELPEQVSLCQTDAVLLESNILNEADYDSIVYQWFKDGNEIEGADTSFVSVGETGSYQLNVGGELLSLEGEASGEFCDTTLTVEVTTADYVVDLGPDQELCDQGSYTITSTVTGEDASNLNFTWEDQDGAIDGETDPELTVGENGTYIVTAEAQGCIEMDTISVVFNESPVIDLGEEIEVCDLTTVTLDATPSNFNTNEVTFNWSFNGSGIPETGAVVNAQDYGYGVYQVNAFGSSQECSSTQSITVSERGDITVEIESDDSDNTLCIGGEVTLSAILQNASEGEVEFTWFKNNTVIDGETGTSITVTADEAMSGTDVFAVEISLGNCFDDAEVEIDLYDNAECIITEGLSPNTTPGQNDCLDLTFLNDRTGINKLTVYNRYGREIYSESNYTDSWCGQDSNQNIVSTGTYYYVIDIAGDDPVFGSVKKGWIYINREINN